jgi:peroxiredoxin
MYEETNGHLGRRRGATQVGADVMRSETQISRGIERRRSICVALGTALAICLTGASARALDPGDEAPGFSLTRLDSAKAITLADYRGKVVWLDFWASWCGPCLRSLPQLEEMGKTLPSKHFQIVAVNLDQNPKQARKFLEKHPTSYPSGTDPKGKVPDSYGLETMPTSYLIDRDGVIRHVHEGFREGDIEDIRHEIVKLLKRGR